MSRENLIPPVDVEGLLRARVASVERADWPFHGVDAVAMRSGTQDQDVQVFIRATSNLMRERFTLAHELAHVLIPWHLLRPDCAIGDGRLDLKGTSIENEADVFASCVLVPDRWLDDLFPLHRGDMTLVLGHLSAAEVSTQAAVLALRRYLLAGWVFEIPRICWTVSTPGTAVSDFANRAQQTGSALLNGERVSWFDLRPKSGHIPSRAPGDTRSDHEILLTAIASLGLGEAVTRRIVQSANGKVGGALRDAAGRSRDDAFATMLYRFSDWTYAKLVSNEDFRLWLALRCSAIESGGTKRRRRGG